MHRIGYLETNATLTYGIWIIPMLLYIQCELEECLCNDGIKCIFDVALARGRVATKYFIHT